MAQVVMLDHKPAKQSSVPDGREFTALSAFVWEMLEATEGRLSLDKNNKTGSLIDFLRAVTPHLPPGFVPNNLPLSHLQRLKTHWTKTRTGAA